MLRLRKFPGPRSPHRSAAGHPAER